MPCSCCSTMCLSHLWALVNSYDRLLLFRSLFVENILRRVSVGALRMPIMSLPIKCISMNNMTLSFAGLISAAPGRRNSSLQNSAKQVESMVRGKMEQKEYIILCLEDSNDWSNATTRRMVMQVRAVSILVLILYAVHYMVSQAWSVPDCCRRIFAEEIGLLQLSKMQTPARHWLLS